MNVWSPSARLESTTGDVQTLADAPSSAQRNVAEPSSLENVSVASRVATVPVGPVSIVVDGAVRSIVHACVSGVMSALPAASVANTRSTCGPSTKPAR